jgi:hypothetical protein
VFFAVERSGERTITNNDEDPGNFDSVGQFAAVNLQGHGSAFRLGNVLAFSGLSNAVYKTAFPRVFELTNRVNFDVVCTGHGSGASISSGGCRGLEAGAIVAPDDHNAAAVATGAANRPMPCGKIATPVRAMDRNRLTLVGRSGALNGGARDVFRHDAALIRVGITLAR